MTEHQFEPICFTDEETNILSGKMIFSYSGRVSTRILTFESVVSKNIKKKNDTNDTFNISQRNQEMHFILNDQNVFDGCEFSII